MKSGRTKLAFLAIVAVCALLAFALFRGEPPNLSSRPALESVTIAPPAAVSSGSAFFAEQPSAKPLVPAHARNVSARSPLLHEYLRQQNLGVLLKRLQALKGNREAQYLAHEIARRCIYALPIVLETYRGIASRDPDPKNFEKRLVALDRLANDCNAVTSEEANTILASTYWEGVISELVEAGDLRARSYVLHSPTIADVHRYSLLMTEVPTMLAAQDPLVTENIARYYLEKHQNRSFSIDGVNGQVSGADIAAALSLLSCEQGIECGPNSYLVTGQCAYVGRCDFPHWSAYLYTQLSRAENIDRLPEISSVIRRAIATGNWPKGMLIKGFPFSQQ